VILPILIGAAAGIAAAHYQVPQKLMKAKRNPVDMTLAEVRDALAEAGLQLRSHKMRGTGVHFIQIVDRGTVVGQAGDAKLDRAMVAAVRVAATLEGPRTIKGQVLRELADQW
jgi:hypothetical protein